MFGVWRCGFEIEFEGETEKVSDAVYATENVGWFGGTKKVKVIPETYIKPIVRRWLSERYFCEVYNCSHREE